MLDKKLEKSENKKLKAYFFEEISIMAKLFDKNIVRIKHYLMEAGVHYILMEYCENDTLVDYLYYKKYLNQL